MNRTTLKAVVLFALFRAIVVQGQTYQAPPTFKHIVIIVQENRTPDDLFQPSVVGAPCGNQNRFEPGVDIQNGGPNLASQNNHEPYITCMTPVDNLSQGGTSHKHAQWVLQYDNGAMDGACLNTTWPNCPQYDSVSQNVVQPYFDIATNYGWANYMFSTHEGPSFPSHQFLFGGTSAPVWPGDSNQYYKYFVAENGPDSGCPDTTNTAAWIDPAGFELADPNNSECYDHNTLVTYQENNTVYDKTTNLENGGWKYYAQKPGSIWDAPEANPQTCYFATGGGGKKCNSSEFSSHVVFEGGSGLTSAPILQDIQKCQLASITWVTPDEAWSDHPGMHDMSLGPAWVADIVDAIGNSWTQSKGQCDYWGTNSTTPEPTAIFITWDDWGGFYDHVPPPAVYRGAEDTQGQWACDAPNSWGCGYVYGYRVPLLVVSEYTPAGTISGKLTGPPTYPPPQEWTHDFGSILKFTENNFWGPTAQIAPPGYSYADSNSLDSNGGTYIPLWDFFLGSPRSFTTINPGNSQYNASYFMNYYTTPQNGYYPAPIGPDGGDDD